MLARRSPLLLASILALTAAACGGTDSTGLGGSNTGTGTGSGTGTETGTDTGTDTGTSTGAGGVGQGGQGQGGQAQGGSHQGGSGQGGQAQGGSNQGGQAQGGSGQGGQAQGGQGQGGQAQGGQGQGGNPNCAGLASVDNDGDGYTELQGDCNDCDPNTNPGAVDVIGVDANGNALPDNQQYDEDCDGKPALPSDPSCDIDPALSIDSADPIAGAKAIDLCKVSVNGSWGILKAEYVNIDGTPLPQPNGGLGHGILPKFGANVTPKLGVKMLALSSGTARGPLDPGYQDVKGFDKAYQAGNPPGFPIESPSCQGVVTGQPHDGVALRLDVKVPSNAKSFNFKFKFHTYEFPDFICSQYNDFFVALLNPPPVDVDPINKNIAFDGQKNPISVNNALLDVCKAGTYGNKVFPCPGDINELAGTGFDNSGATSWLQTAASVTPGGTITLTFGVYDSGDGVLDSTTLVDAFQWSADPAKTGTGNACLTGGSGTCDACVSDATFGNGCCADAWKACQGNQSCAKLTSCISLCKGNANCEQGCFNNNAAGKPLYDATIDCLYGPANDPAAVGACGVVCK